MTVLKRDKERERSRRVNFPLRLLSVAWIGTAGLKRHIGIQNKSTDPHPWVSQHTNQYFPQKPSSPEKARKQMLFSPVWNIKCFRGSWYNLKLFLLERPFKYSVLERIQLEGQMKLKLRPVIKSHQTYASWKAKGHQYKLRSPAATVFVILSCAIFTAAFGDFLKICKQNIQSDLELRRW